jgi:anti-sigma regulatory factor (Ser/Thr protein kinase)
VTPPPAAAAPTEEKEPSFRHELYPYEGESAFLSGALSFIDDALTGGETVLIAVGADKREMLRSELTRGGSKEQVSFVDTDSLGRTPGRLIPAWQDWIAKSVSDGLPVRGISESPWEAASPPERVELRYHEWLVNLAFVKSPAWWLLCPYDTTAVEPAALESARHCHPFQLTDGAHGANPAFVDEPFAFTELTAPCDPDEALRYGAGGLAAVRGRVTTCAARHGLEGTRLRELLVAATEVAGNSVRHGGGSGTLRTWAEDGEFICEFHDAGHIDNPLAGRVRPTPRQPGGRGLWLVHQLCDLVQIRSTAEHGTTIRLHLNLR